MRFQKLLPVCAIIIFFLQIQTVKADYAKRVIVETQDGIVAVTWLEKVSIKQGQDIIVNYTLRNNSKRTIYVVTEPRPRIYVDTENITIKEPLPLPYGVDTEYNFNFHEVKTNKVYRGKLVVPSEEVKGEGSWNVNIGIAYVYNKEGIDRKRIEGEDPIQLPELLLQRATGIQLGSLNVEIRGPILLRRQ